jgi:hypothetical protein
LDNVLVDYHTSIAQNLNFIIPLLLFCIASLTALWIVSGVFKKQGVIKSN